MNRSAVLHIPMSQYAYGTDEEHIVIRLRAGRGDLTECILHYGDRACRLTPVLFTEQKMAVVAQTEEFDYWETTLEHPYKRLCYYFTLSDGREEVLYYGERFTDHTVDDRSEYYQLPFNHRADIVTPPEWAQNTIIYNIFPVLCFMILQNIGSLLQIGRLICRYQIFTSHYFIYGTRKIPLKT